MAAILTASRRRPPGRIARVLIVPTLLVLVALLIAQNMRRQDSLRAEVVRSYDARADVQTLLSLLQDAENSQRGYLLTGQQTFLAPYLRAKARLPAQMAKVTGTFAADPIGRERFARLRTLVSADLDELAGEIDLRDRDGPAAAVDRVGDGRGKRLMDQIRLAVADLAGAEERSLARRQAAAAGVRANIDTIGGLAFAFLLAVMIAAQWLDQRRYAQRATLLGRLNDNADRLSAIFEGAMDGIITLDPSGGVEAINGAGARMFGYRPEELLRRNISILADPAGQGFEAFLERLRRGEVSLDAGVLRESVGRRRDGSTFPIDVALRGMSKRDGVHVVAVVRDISERRRVETLKQEFVSTVSHELRTPLTSIAGALGLLKAGAGGRLPERAGRLVQIAESNSARLVRLINNILDVEKFESGHAAFVLTPQSLNDLARRAAEMMEGLAEKREVRLAVTPAEPDPGVQVDPDRILQVLTNLLSNAIKFSPPGGAVELRVEHDRDRGRIVVIDHGAGVPEGFQPRLFQKFAQADGSDGRSHGGTGLGLVIAREIAELHEGALTYRETAGGGATFLLALPLSTPAPAATASSKPRLLVCEDDRLTANHLRHELVAVGFDVDVAGGANEARLALHSVHYAALLLDLGLPDEDGLSLVRSLRAAPGTREMPIIIVSGSIDSREDGRLLDVIDWIEKPVDFARLQAALRIALARQVRAAPLILHVDDDKDLLEVARGVLGGAGEIVTAHSLADARRAMAARRPDVVVLDLGLPDGSGAELIPDLIDEKGAAIPVIVYTAQDPGPELDAQVVSVFTKSRVGLQRLADTVRRATDPASRVAAAGER